MTNIITVGLFLVFCFIGGVINYALEEDHQNERLQEYLRRNA